MLKPQTFPTKILLLSLLVNLSNQRAINRTIYSHSNNLNSTILTDGPIYNIRYKPYEDLYTPEGFSITGTLSFVTINLWLSFKTSYISFITHECKNCLSSKSLVNSLWKDSVVLDHYLKKSWEICGEGINYCENAGANRISGKITQENFYFKNWIAGSVFA